MRAPIIALLLLTGCASEAPARPAPAAAGNAQAAPAEGDETTAADLMWHNFRDVADARDAVIAGKLEAVRPPLQRLATRDHEAQIPSDWLIWVNEMQAEAKRGAAATDLAAAASSVAALGAQCAECHRATRGGPELAGDEHGYDAHGRKGLQEKMARHNWSAKELWLGLSEPHHPAWSRGAAALMNITVPKLVTHTGEPATTDRPPTGEGTLGGEADPDAPDEAGSPSTASSGAVDLDVSLRELRELGQKADAAKIPRDKQLIYGQIIDRCGNCHQRLGIQLQ